MTRACGPDAGRAQPVEPVPRRGCISIDGQHLRIQTLHHGQIDIPIDDLAVQAIAGSAVNGVQLRIELRLNGNTGFDIRHYVNAVQQAWELARAEGQEGGAAEAPATPPVPAVGAPPVPLSEAPPVPAVEPPKPIRGPTLLPGGGGWVILRPLVDTCRLSQGTLLAPDSPPGGGPA
ncbi:MAG TPA: hypothetical protein VFC00_21045 [Micromonosporaceae bacterium]|nr:hypothetical protein [Micromonosporaceae bacterium]